MLSKYYFIKYTLIYLFYNLITIVTTQAQLKQPIDTTGIVYTVTANSNQWINMSKGLPDNLSIGLGGITHHMHQITIATKEYGIFKYNQLKKEWENTPTPEYILKGIIGPVIDYKNELILGTQHNGVYVYDHLLKQWQSRNQNLRSKTIRRFVILNSQLYLCTNNGFYVWQSAKQTWKWLYGDGTLQINGATFFKNLIYLATNKGVFKQKEIGDWENILPNNSVHNIGNHEDILFAMTYTSLLLASSNGIQWTNAQNGLPSNLYTFNIVSFNGKPYAGQWDGVYTQISPNKPWIKWSIGLPSNLAATNLLYFKNQLVLTAAERKTK